MALKTTKPTRSQVIALARILYEMGANNQMFMFARKTILESFTAWGIKLGEDKREESEHEVLLELVKRGAKKKRATKKKTNKRKK